MSISKPKIIPKTPGVYVFRKGKTPVYVGKAANLKSRLLSYFRKDVSDKVRELTREANNLEWIEAPSEVEALIQEAELIKAHVPKYNILMRDDKNYFYIGITREDFPRIFLTHQPHAQETVRKNRRVLQATSYKLSRSQSDRGSSTSIRNTNKTSGQASYIGPFTSGSALKGALRILRSLFPYCTCKEEHKRPCLNAQIGRCLGYCCIKSAVPNPEQVKEYRRNIQSIIAVLSGRRKSLLLQLKRELRLAVKEEAFENAAKLRDETIGLENIFSHASSMQSHKPLRRPLDWTKVQRNLKEILGAAITRAEGYDISNISGTEATGSMVVFTNGRPDKSEYRVFGIKTINQPNDIAMHKEVMARRLNHPEWKYPDLILIDGGRAQLNAALEIVRKREDLRISVAALAKREEELYTENRKDPVLLRNLPPDTAFFLQHVRDESHRFAKKYHHKRREILYRQNQ